MNDEPATFRATAPFRRRASLAIEISCRPFSAVAFRLATSPHSEAVPRSPETVTAGLAGLHGPGISMKRYDALRIAGMSGVLPQVKRRPVSRSGFFALPGFHVLCSATPL